MSGPENADEDDPVAAEQRLLQLHLTAFGARVRDIRGLRRMTQETLAERTGMPRSNIAAIERGKNVTLETLHRIARGLDVHWAELLDDREVADLPRYRPPAL